MLSVHGVHMECSRCAQPSSLMYAHKSKVCHERVLLNSSESPRLWGLRMARNFLHMADLGLLGNIFGLHLV